MAKGKDFSGLEDEELERQPARQKGKLPIDDTGAGSVMVGFQTIPVTMLHPFTLKGTSDYSRHDQYLSEQFVQSIRDFGILETLIVRKSPQTKGMYEIIAGESRWIHATAAECDTVPCRIMNLDDSKAKKVFHITNLLHRKLIPSDLINGWYEYYTELYGNRILSEEEIERENTEIAMLAGSDDGPSLRTIQRYVKMHSLIKDWFDRLDAGKTSMRIGYRVAFFPPDIQDELLAYKVNEKKLEWLYEIYSGKNQKITWSSNVIADNLESLPNPTEKEGREEEAQKPKPVKLTKEEQQARKQARIYNKAFKQAAPKLLETAKAKIRPTDYERADEIIEQALELYYSQNV